MTFISIQDDKLVWRKGNETLQIEAWGRDSLRVRSTMSAEIVDRAWALLDPEKCVPRIGVGESSGEIENGKIKAVISSDGRIRFATSPGGKILLEEPPVHIVIPAGREYKSLGSDLWRIEARFLADEGERIYGLGQHRSGLLNQKGCVIPLEQRNSEIAIPFALSNRGYGFLWNNPAIGRVELGANGTRWVAEACRQVDYFITTGDNPAEILERYTCATGRPPMLPHFASGFWQCKLRYKTQDELLSVAREYKKRELPLSVIVIDFYHWPMMGDWRFDLEEWPDPAAMVKELEGMGVKVMVSVWPAVSPNSENFKEMNERGLLLRSERGIPLYIQFKDKLEGRYEHLYYYDSTNPEARKFMWGKFRDNYRSHGIKVWWLDGMEPEIYPYHPENVRYHMGSGLEVGCIYPWTHQLGFYEGMKSEGETEIITLCRSAWAGSQRFGSAVWSGDIFSTFESLRVQVRAGLNIGLSGIPWWTTDIGGFLNGKPEDPTFRELIVRWFQYGAFCPLFRLHGCREPFKDGTGADNEAWSFGDRAYEIIREYMFIRERLRPYIMDQMQIAHEAGLPVMRPLFFDFPDDRISWEIEDEYMFGPDILVAPILYEGARGRAVYLPSGSNWTDVWTGAKSDGGQWVEASAPLERIPLYYRGDARPPILG